MDEILNALACVLNLDWDYRKPFDWRRDPDGLGSYGEYLGEYLALSTALKGLACSRGRPFSVLIHRPLGEAFEDQMEQPSGITRTTQPSLFPGKKRHSRVTCLRGYHHFRFPSNKRTLNPKKPSKARDLDLAEDTVLPLLSRRRKRTPYCPRKSWENEDATDYSFVDVNM